MKRFACAAAATVALGAIAAPANAAVFEWTVEYKDFWSDGASLTGAIQAEEDAALDGIITSDEFLSWMWDWSGNGDVEAFSISSEDEFAEVDFDPALNLGENPFMQGFFASEMDSVLYSIDFDFLLVDAFDFEAAADPFYQAPFSEADTDGTVDVSAQPVPEPATVLGLIALATVGATVQRQKQAA